jgi:asparagine N-glycosylation enzyme membrane subunit Stt3
MRRHAAPGTAEEPAPNGDKPMSLGTILLIVLILLLIGAIPSWPHSRSWGYGPSGGLGLVVVVVIVLLLLGRL